MFFKEKLISRVLSEANDLKRTPQAMAQELGICFKKMEQIMRGESTLEEIYDLIQKMGQYYPIDASELMLIEPDFEHGVKYMSARDSEKSTRIFHRIDKTGELKPYYEYRDTVMSRISPFKPEWIRELRVVNNDDPCNLDVVYNKGHFLHQLTFFVGPVNFYWDINGDKCCAQMNTGDSNYITPFWPHSFTSRNANQLGLILAITFGGEVRRAQKEIYLLGKGIKNYGLNYREPGQAIIQLVRQHMLNENMTQAHLQENINRYDSNVSISKLLSGEVEFTTASLTLIAQLLHIEVSDLQVPFYKKEDEVIVTHSYTQDAYEYPSKQDPRYLIKSLARSSKMPQMKGFDIQVCHQEAGRTAMDVYDFTSSLHSYVYNYGEQAVTFVWQDKGISHEKILYPGDSVYILPFIAHSFRSEEKSASLFVARVSGAIHFSVQKELSYFSDLERAAFETTCWFDGK